MTDHPNQFAIGQPVLFLSLADPLDNWRPGAIASVTDISSVYHRVDYGDYKNWEAESKNHDATCGGFSYDILPPGDSPRRPFTDVCTCRYRIADASAADSGRWDDTPMITDRLQLQLLLTDTGGDLEIDSSDTPLGETDIVHLAGRGGESAEVDIHDLVKWAGGAS